MEKKRTNGQVIIVFTEHPTLGPLLIPYIADKLEDGTLQLAEQAFHASSQTIAQMSDAERQAIDIASYYTDKYLMGIYSREKTVAHFLHKLSEEPERVKTNIRPFIEKKLLEMLTLIRQSGLPLYQKQPGSKVLYAHHAYRIHLHNVRTRFTFQVDSSTFRYQLQCYYEDRPLSLSEKKPVIALTSSPVTLLMGMDLYFFAHIESTRVLPFTKKDSISADASQTDKYIDNIVIPIARYHEIETHGLDIIEEAYSCEALLSVEDTVYDEQLLQLSFRYARQTFAPDNVTDTKKIVYRKDSGEICFFRRDHQAEEKALRLLTESGLRQVSDAHFGLSPDAVENTIPQWINNHREMLQTSFQLSANMGNTPYCLDEIHIEQSCDNEPDWFELRITVVIGHLRIPFTRFRRHILEGKREYILPDGRMMLLPDEWFSKYTNLLETGVESEKGIRLKHAFIGVAQSALDPSNAKSIGLGQQIEDTPTPPRLKAQLRPYQQKGFSWMVSLSKQGLGGCLADDMGLGKTLQTLTLLQHIYAPEEKAASSPMNTEAVVDAEGQYSLFSFASEAELLPEASKIKESTQPPADKKTPGKPSTLIVVPTSLLHNWRRETKRFTSLSMAEYGSATSINKQHPERFFNRYHLVFTTYGMMRNNIELLSSYTFEYIILDESQNIKNSDSLTFRSAIRLQSNHRLVLTGTPIENSLKDLWTQFRFIQPDLLGTEAYFQKHFIAPIRQGNTRIEMYLQQLIAPFILRRSKSEVAPELPPLTEETIYCDMTEEQNALYQQEKNGLRNMLLQHAQADANKPHSFSILNGILRLRQLACHPKLLRPDFTLPSGKTEQLIETFETLQSEGHKVLIFSSFVTYLDILAQAFRERGWKYALLTGSTQNRPEEIAHFTEQNDMQAFLISLKAGGVGLNLTQADYVFIVDPWWNPAAESQAIARAHRIGQDKQVIAYRFITQHSIEEKILLLQEEKRKLAQTFVADTDAVPTLTNEQWTELIG